MNHRLRQQTHIVLRPVRPITPADFPMPAGGRNPTLAQWLDRWMEREVEYCRAKTTAYGYRNIIKNHVSPALGRVRLSQLTPGLLEEYYRWIAREKNLSANTVHKHHVLLHTSLQSACRQGLLSSNPASLALPPRFQSADAKFYTPEQLGRLLQEVRGHSLELPVRLACGLGLRRGEILGLRWRDVNLEAGLLSICKTRTTAGHQVVEKTPKTEKSCRTLGISGLNQLVALLRQIQTRRIARGIPCGPEDLLVLDSRGLPWHPDVLTQTFREFVSRKKLPLITLHGLRHTFASVASNARVPMYQISRAMGHSSPATTQRVYTHLFEPTHEEVLVAVAASIPDFAAKV